jgi:hypothetical protein
MRRAQRAQEAEAALAGFHASAAARDAELAGLRAELRAARAAAEAAAAKRAEADARAEARRHASAEAAAAQAQACEMLMRGLHGMRMQAAWFKILLGIAAALD